ncbi:Hydrogenase maturation factor HypB [Neomoorella glycerini]|uniref:Hydrogenase maturation factor HypB n=1 Tax=Neomoorella glycerini TaxID=55779 RepID=A0A6I5ZMB6_9FIRM|nr:hydrogenase nickel incorporation protein HypB [Moorella glycerini]QGP91012.1 Hydrogenase maturation factor HypB [Moorella glycerini]
MKLLQIKLVSSILGVNDTLAAANRELFREKGVFVLNLMSSPGSGKTTILERTIEHLQHQLNIGVIEGDICTARDAERIAQKGVPVVQINTSGACHLDANMIASCLEDLNLDELDLLVVENVGNLVCPAEFDIGEDMKVMVLSVTEGNDKPCKYPLMFRESRALLVNKIDLLPYTNFDMDALEQDVRGINSAIQIFPVSALKDEGVEAWCQWLTQLVRRKREK